MPARPQSISRCSAPNQNKSWHVKCYDRLLHSLKSLHISNKPVDRACNTNLDCETVFREDANFPRHPCGENSLRYKIIRDGLEQVSTSENYC